MSGRIDAGDDLIDSPVFLFGTLCDPALRDIVLGRAVSGRAARLEGCRAVCIASDKAATLVAAPEAQVAGLVLDDLSAADAARLDYYLQVCGYFPLQLFVPERARGFIRKAENADTGQAWDAAIWQAAYADVTRAAAVEIMNGFADLEVAQARARLPVIRTRAQAEINAAQMPAPVAARTQLGRDDVTLLHRRRAYSDFFAVDDLDLTHRRFDGTHNPAMRRAVFVMADAVTVLPYDPQRDQVLLIEQFRAGPYRRGDPAPWLLEAIAGRVDAFESYEAAARREAREEAGLELHTLHHIASYYSSPGAVSEFMVSYLALCDLPEGVEGLGGLAGEAEDIRSLRMAWSEAEQALDAGQIANAPLLASLLWLRSRRDQLRQAG